jgi:hypothetical protein
VALVTLRLESQWIDLLWALVGVAAAVDLWRCLREIGSR